MYHSVNPDSLLSHLELEDGALAVRALSMPAKQLQQRPAVAVLQRR
jgi:hypothetical protein